MVGVVLDEAGMALHSLARYLPGLGVAADRLFLLQADPAAAGDCRRGMSRSQARDAEQHSGNEAEHRR